MPLNFRRKESSGENKNVFSCDEDKVLETQDSAHYVSFCSLSTDKSPQSPESRVNINISMFNDDIGEGKEVVRELDVFNTSESASPEKKLPDHITSGVENDDDDVLFEEGRDGPGEHEEEPVQNGRVDGIDEEEGVEESENDNRSNSGSEESSCDSLDSGRSLSAGDLSSVSTEKNREDTQEADLDNSSFQDNILEKDKSNSFTGASNGGVVLSSVSIQREDESSKRMASIEISEWNKNAHSGAISNTKITQENKLSNPKVIKEERDDIFKGPLTPLIIARSNMKNSNNNAEINLNENKNKVQDSSVQIERKSNKIQNNDNVASSAGGEEQELCNFHIEDSNVPYLDLYAALAATDPRLAPQSELFSFFYHNLNVATTTYAPQESNNEIVKTRENNSNTSIERRSDGESNALQGLGSNSLFEVGWSEFGSYQKGKVATDVRITLQQKEETSASGNEINSTINNQREKIHGDFNAPGCRIAAFRSRKLERAAPLPPLVRYVYPLEINSYLSSAVNSSGEPKRVKIEDAESTTDSNAAKIVSARQGLATLVPSIRSSGENTYTNSSETPCEIAVTFPHMDRDKTSTASLSPPADDSTFTSSSSPRPGAPHSRVCDEDDMPQMIVFEKDQTFIDLRSIRKYEPHPVQQKRINRTSTSNKMKKESQEEEKRASVAGDGEDESGAHRRKHYLTSKSAREMLGTELCRIYDDATVSLRLRKRSRRSHATIGGF